MLAGELHRDTGRAARVALALVAGLRPLEQREHLVVALRPAGSFREALEISRLQRAFGVRRAELLVRGLPAVFGDELAARAHDILRYRAQTRLARPLAGALQSFHAVLASISA